MILKDFSRVLLEELDADCPLPGDPSRPVAGLAVDEPLKGWIGRDEAVFTAREALDEDFLENVASFGSPVVVWRSDAAVASAATEKMSALGLALLVLPPTCRCGGCR
ncbi:hypothetical protein GBA63_12895 [Rubrobacter tropicus]|uniref:Uncharacterized protein n=1 Tax=Rubrobacter tropicus TaxID=2653851 RepID=A0A6G8QAI1_9ACTN|nr:hypothetical protein [Rubrobacter tropicus]QIN83432.1 hypothetical protein GBA63_12895 [Rubrobacter tropicus]